MYLPGARSSTAMSTSAKQTDLINATGKKTLNEAVSLMLLGRYEGCCLQSLPPPLRAVIHLGTANLTVRLKI